MTAPNAIAVDALRRWVAALLVTRGVPPADAAPAAEALLDADLQGVDTHGITMLPGYLDQMARGILNPRPDIAVERRGAMLRVDADRGLGHVVVPHVLDRAVALARAEASVTAVISDVGHLGALGYFARRAAAQGMIALVLQNGPPLMGLPGSTSRAIGNNPLAFAVPVADGPPIVFDVATSEVAYGKLIAARHKKQALPEGWALDRSGQPTTDPRAGMEGILLPSGGAKGIGLAMLIEVLAGSLTGTRPVFGEQIFGAFLLVVDPAAGHTGFAEHVAGWLATYAGSGPQARYPGQRAEAVRAERARSGIVLAGPLLATLQAIGAEAGLPLPAVT